MSNLQSKSPQSPMQNQSKQLQQLQSSSPQRQIYIRQSQLKQSSSRKQDPKQQQKLKTKQYIDNKTIMHRYKMQHSEVDKQLVKLRQKILNQFDMFHQEVVVTLNHMNYLRYINAYPEDDIQFIFQSATSQGKSQDKQVDKNINQDIMNRMMTFPLLEHDQPCGITQNCQWQIQQTIYSKQVLNFAQLVPTATTFLARNRPAVDKYITLWKLQSTQDSSLSTLFKQVSGIFPKQDINKLGTILTQTNKIPISSRLLFRASEHNFQSAVFKERCGGVGNTLLIARSDKGKTFGGYSPAKWLNSKEKQYVGDPSGMSYLFSLNENLVFLIKKTQLDYAISVFGGWGPIYGSPYGPDLSISDKCHLNEHSCSSLGSHYEIPSNIKQFSNEAFNLLAGGKKFKVVQYQLHQLILE